MQITYSLPCICPILFSWVHCITVCILFCTTCITQGKTVQKHLAVRNVARKPGMITTVSLWVKIQTTHTHHTQTYTDTCSCRLSTDHDVWMFCDVVRKLCTNLSQPLKRHKPTYMTLCLFAFTAWSPLHCLSPALRLQWYKRLLTQWVQSSVSNQTTV